MPASTPYEVKKALRGRRVLALGKLKQKSVPKVIKPCPSVSIKSEEIEGRFQICAFPSAVEIFKLSERTDLPVTKIRSEFKVRRQQFRQRHKLAEDTVFDSYTVPRIILLLGVLCSRLRFTQQTLAEITVFAISVLSTVWYSKAKHSLDLGLGHLIPLEN